MPRTTTRRASGRARRPSSLLDHLEPRLVLAAPFDFFAAGIRFDDGPRVFMTEGVIDESNAITGTTTFADHAGAQSTSPVDWTSLTRGMDGAFTFGTRDGFTPYASQTGTQFLYEERRYVGSFVGSGANGALRDFAVLGQIETTGSTLDPLVADFSMTRLTASGALETFEVLVSTTNFEGTTARFLYRLPSGDISVDKTIISRTAGRVQFNTGETLIFTQKANSDFTPAFIVDFDAADGIVGIAIGRQSRIADDSGYAGRYRSAVLVDGPIAAAFLGVDPASVTPGHPVAVNVVVELNFWNNNDTESIPNTFRIYRQSEWDAGMRTPVTEGTWTFDVIPDAQSLRHIRLDDGAGTTMHLRPAMPRVLAFADVQNGATSESITGSGAAISRRFLGGSQEVFVDVDASGNPIAYMQFGSTSLESELYSIDLVNEVGGEAVVGSLVTWVARPEAGRDRYVAGLSATGDLQLWRMSADTLSWSYINLTEHLDGARPITSDLFNTGSSTDSIRDTIEPIPPQAQHQTLAGYDADGNFVAYRFLDPGAAVHASRWQFVDVEVDGVGGAGAVPNVVGGLSGWNSSWGGVHFAGVDSNGELWVIWWTPTLEQWQVSSLTQAAGAPQLVPARPSTTRTDWDTFHVAATDAQGHIIITWWNREADQWLAGDLTSIAGGPAVQTGTLAAGFAGPLDNLAIGALDANGAAVLYWWNVSSGWQTSTISGGAPTSLVPQTRLLFTSARYSTPTLDMEITQSFVGQNAQGSLARFTWRVSTNEWTFQDITAESMPYVVM